MERLDLSLLDKFFANKKAQDEQEIERIKQLFKKYGKEHSYSQTELNVLINLGFLPHPKDNITDNTMTIKPTPEKTWNRNEVIDMMYKFKHFHDDIRKNGRSISTSEWLEENLK